MLRPPSRLAAAAVAGVLAGTVCAATLSAPVQAAAPSTPFISEIHYDNTGSDIGEFVEVQLPAGSTSAGLSVVLYNGGNGAFYDTDPLPVVAASDGSAAVAVVDYPANGLQNGSPDAIALVDADGDVLEFLSYEGTVTATNGPAADLTSVDIGVAEPGGDPAGLSLSRVYDAATDGLLWSGPAAATNGQVNATVDAEPEPEPVVCEAAPTHQIGAVQGSGASTPLADQQVTVRGVVVGDVPGLSGWYLQDADGDGDPATSDGVFVFSDLDVDLGDTVAVIGEAEERFGQTQIGFTEAEVCADGSTTDLPDPTAFDLPADDAERERLEGMLVEAVDVLTVSELFDLTRFGELILSEGGALVQPTELARPGTPEAAAIVAENRLRTIVLDDGLSSRVSVSTAPYLSSATPVRVGDDVEFTEPVVLGYGFDAWRLQPADGTADGVFAPQNTRTLAPDAVGGNFQVGAFNVLNYFLTFGGEGRGARTQEQLERQAGKIVPAIESLGADIVTLMEIEDTDSTDYSPGNADRALADLVRRLNEAAGYQKWTYVPLPEELYGVERDVIRNGIIYQPGEVETVGEPIGLVDESIWYNAREPLAQTFVADGDVFTVVANHFKSKSPGKPTGDNVDTGDGQGSWNGDRKRQSASLATFTERLADTSGDDDVLLLGDFNAYTQEDPIQALREAGFTDLGELLDPGRYSYVFSGLSGSLDHALASQELVGKVTGLTHWNINAVESFAYQYSGDLDLYSADPYRSSDHDPLVLGIDVEERCDGLLPTIVGTDGDEVLRGTSGVDVIIGLHGDDTVLGGSDVDVICGGFGEDTLSGGSGDDRIFGGADDDVLNGDNGDDVLVGGAGDDTLRQGRGRGFMQQ